MEGGNEREQEARQCPARTNVKTPAPNRRQPTRDLQPPRPDFPREDLDAFRLLESYHEPGLFLNMACLGNHTFQVVVTGVLFRDSVRQWIHHLALPLFVDGRTVPRQAVGFVIRAAKTLCSRLKPIEVVL